MEIRHFVYGKFNSKQPDFGIRVMDKSAPPDELKKQYNEIIAFFISHFRQVFYAPYPEINPEVILKIADQYVYARFFPPFYEERGTLVECLFHAFVFTNAELEAINYCPWRLKRQFIRAYTAEEITGADGTSWLKKDESRSISYAVKTVDISVTKSPPFPASYESFTPYFVIDNKDPESALTNLPAPNRLALFSSGIILNGTVKALNKFFGKPLHIVFLANAGSGLVPVPFTQLTESELSTLKPIESAREEKQPFATKESAPKNSSEPEKHKINPVLTVSPPADLKLSVERNKITIDFSNYNSFDVIAIIERKLDKDNYFIEINNNIKVNKGSVGQFADVGIKNGDEYIYQIMYKVPENATSSSDYTQTSPVKTYPVAIEAASFKIDRDSDTPSITLTWTAAINSYQVSYEVSKTKLSEGRSHATETIKKGYLKTTFSDSDIAFNQEYLYQIKVLEPESGFESLPAATPPIKVAKISPPVIIEETTAADEDTPAEVVPEENDVKKNKKKRIWIAAICLSLIVVLAIVWFIVPPFLYNITGSKTIAQGDTTQLKVNGNVQMGDGWTIKSGDQYVGLNDSGLVTGLKPGTAEVDFMSGIFTSKFTIQITEPINKDSGGRGRAVSETPTTAVGKEGVAVWKVKTGDAAAKTVDAPVAQGENNKIIITGKVGTAEVEDTKTAIGDNKPAKSYAGVDLLVTRDGMITIKHNSLLNTKVLILTGAVKFTSKEDPQYVKIINPNEVDIILGARKNNLQIHFVPMIAATVPKPVVGVTTQKKKPGPGEKRADPKNASTANHTGLAFGDKENQTVKNEIENGSKPANNKDQNATGPAKSPPQKIEKPTSQPGSQPKAITPPVQFSSKQQPLDAHIALQKLIESRNKFYKDHQADSLVDHQDFANFYKQFLTDSAPDNIDQTLLPGSTDKNDLNDFIKRMREFNAKAKGKDIPQNKFKSFPKFKSTK